MPRFETDAARVDPYRNFRFHILWDGKVVAGASRVSGLEDRTGAVRHRDGAGPTAGRPVPGQSSFEAITIERGITHDAGFERWATNIRDFSGGATGDPRKDIRIALIDEAGHTVLAWDVRRCWPSQFTGRQELDGKGAGLVVATLVLQNEGWERDLGVAAAASPSA